MEEYKHLVQYYETDKMGVVHHSNYIRWMEEARVDYLRKIGWSYEKLEEKGIVSPVTSIDCKYRASAHFPDVVTVRTAIEEFHSVRLRLRYVIVNEAGTLLVEGHSEHCFLNPDGTPMWIKKAYPDFCQALTDHVEGKVDLTKAQK